MKNPGKRLEEMINAYSMSRGELAKRIDVSEKHLSTVINGEKGISASFARKLGYVFENTQFWLNLQADYDNVQLRIKEENEITSEEISILKNLQDITKYYVNQGYIQNDCGDVIKVMRLREFLKVSNLLYIPKITYNAAYRAQLSKNAKVDPYVLFAWQRLCEKETEDIQAKEKLDIAVLTDSLAGIKEYMFQEINYGIHGLQKMFAECGIKFQVVKNFRGAPVQGFIKCSPEGQLIMCLTIRRQRADTFWFTLFHEIAHVLHGDYTTRFVDFDNSQSNIEIEADTFAANYLIDPEAYREFLQSHHDIYYNDIEEFAESVHVQPYIVVGRLQNDGILDWSDYANRIPKYSWA